MHSGNPVNSLGRIMHSPSARALSRPRPLTRLPSCIKTRNALQTGNYGLRIRHRQQIIVVSSVILWSMGCPYWSGNSFSCLLYSKYVGGVLIFEQAKMTWSGILIREVSIKRVGASTST